MRPREAPIASGDLPIGVPKLREHRALRDQARRESNADPA